MPDAGHRNYPHPRPRRWADAFAALPLESSGPQGWERLRARLPEQPRPAHTRGAWWLAAACMLVAVALPWQMHAPAGESSAQPIVASPGTSDQPPNDGAVASHPVVATATEPPAPRATPSVQPPPRRASDRRRVLRRAPTPAPAPVSPHAGLEALYAESARLEALLAAVPQSSGSGSDTGVLANNIGVELAGIDFLLAQPGLQATLRAELWRQRVAALRELAGIETSRRVLAMPPEHAP